MTQPSHQPAWFCLRTQPKHEHIAAAHLRREQDIEVFLPRIRFKRSGRRGRVWVVEALFPNYLFARFVLATHLRLVRHARGVRGVVHFGDRWPTIPDEVIAALRAAVGEQELRVIEPEIESGDAVRVVEGPLRGLSAVVQRVMPGKERVTVLLEFLGRQTAVQLERDAIAPEEDWRRLVL